MYLELSQGGRGNEVLNPPIKITSDFPGRLTGFPNLKTQPWAGRMAQLVTGYQGPRLRP